MATIGAILKKRIKECGYTQEQFAEDIGIGLSTLKKYIKNEHKYDYELLLKFSNKLDCSLDYLMGLTDTPRRELQTVKDETGLSDLAISNLLDIYRNIEDKDVIWIHKAVSKILENQTMLVYIASYLYGENMPKLNLELRNNGIDTNINNKENISGILIKIIEELARMQPQKEPHITKRV